MEPVCSRAGSTLLHSGASEQCAYAKKAPFSARPRLTNDETPTMGAGKRRNKLTVAEETCSMSKQLLYSDKYLLRKGCNAELD